MRLTSGEIAAALAAAAAPATLLTVVPNPKGEFLGPEFAATMVAVSASMLGGTALAIFSPRHRTLGFALIGGTVTGLLAYRLLEKRLLELRHNLYPKEP